MQKMVAKKKNYLTKEGYEKLVQELNDLKNIKFPKLLERLADAKAMGDLSENFEYKAALEDRELVTSRIAAIEDLIDNVEIIEEKSAKARSKVDYGSVVTFKLDDEKDYTVTIVGTGEVDIDNGVKVSLDSPIGLAMRGKKAGDEVMMRIASGKKTVKILDVK